MSSMSSSPELVSSASQPSSKYHAGNVPTLPQTKCCTLCPAKFTRTTHLNRHLRSHTNERLYHCNTCDSQFTRSDLLARHKRTCGDPNANRSRRKSCQACAASKIKCNLEWPCSKCTSRGRECVFINDPRVSRSKKAAAARRASAASSSTGSDAGSDYFPTPSPTAEVPPNTPSHGCGSAHDTDALGLEFPLHLSLPHSTYNPGSYFPAMAASSSSLGSTGSGSMPSLSSSPTTTASSPSPTMMDPFDAQFVDFGASYGTPDHAALHDQLSKIFPADMFESSFENAYSLQAMADPTGYLMMDQTNSVLPDDPFSFLSDSLEQTPAYAPQTMSSAAYGNTSSYVDPSTLYQQMAQANAPRADANSANGPSTTTSTWSQQVPMTASPNDAMLWGF